MKKNIEIGIATLYNLLTIIEEGYENKPFYASDVNLKGGAIAALRDYGFIKETGNTKESFILVDEYKKLYRKVSAKEWKLVICDFRIKEIKNDLDFLRSLSSRYGVALGI